MTEQNAEKEHVRWVRVRPPFGEAWEHGCCAAFVNGTACGWPRKADGTCGDGHPAQSADAPTYSLADLMAAERVLRTPPATPSADS